MGTVPEFSRHDKSEKPGLSPVFALLLAAAVLGLLAWK